MPIVIKATRIISNAYGDERWRLDDVEGVLDSQELPLLYMNTLPRVHYTPEIYTLFVTTNKDRWELSIGELVSDSEFQLMLTVIQRAANRLASIRYGEEMQKKILENKQKNWHGQEVFTISASS